MHPNSSSDSEPSEYPPLPDGAKDSPEWQAAQESNEHAQLADGRLTLGCFMFWLDSGGYLMTAMPPMGDVRGDRSRMVVYTAEHLIEIKGENLHLLAWTMKQQRLENLCVSDSADAVDESTWAISSITASERSED